MCIYEYTISIPPYTIILIFNLSMFARHTQNGGEGEGKTYGVNGAKHMQYAFAENDKAPPTSGIARSHHTDRDTYIT